MTGRVSTNGELSDGTCDYSGHIVLYLTLGTMAATLIGGGAWVLMIAAGASRVVEAAHYEGARRQYSPIDNRLSLAQPDDPGGGCLRAVAADPDRAGPPEDTRMIGRIAWWATLTLIDLITSALQFDVQSRRSPQLASVVPPPLRGNAQVHIVRSALAGQDPAPAVREAERLIQRRPLPAENLVLLAKGQAKAGQVDAAARNIQIAGQSGWREPLAQEAVLRLALAAGDNPAAARRYAALLLQRQSPDTLLEASGGPFSTRPATPDSRRWWQSSSGVNAGTRPSCGARVMPPAAFSAIVADSLAPGLVFDCPLLGHSAGQVRLRDPAAAADLRRAAAKTCPALAG